MSKSLENLEKDDFLPLIGTSFRIGDYSADLLEVRDGCETPPRFRDPFTLSFKTPNNCAIRSDVLPVSHPEIGEHDLLCVQVMGWDDPTRIEITFN